MVLWFQASSGRKQRMLALYALIVALALVVMMPPTAGVAATRILDVKLIKQYQGNPTDKYDCGPASVASVVQYFGKRPANLTDKQFVWNVRVATGNYRNGNTIASNTTFDQLERALRAYGLSSSRISPTLSPAPDAQLSAMKNAVDAGKPVIALIHGATLGRGPNYGDHWVVVRGITDDRRTVYLVDPDQRSGPQPGWNPPNGGIISVPYSTFLQAAMAAQYGPYGLIVSR